MSKLFFALLIATVVCAVSSSTRTCPHNQEWTECGSACPPACDSKPDQACTMQCIVGCQCRRGLVLNAEGDCIDPSDC